MTRATIQIVKDASAYARRIWTSSVTRHHADPQTGSVRKPTWDEKNQPSPPSHGDELVARAEPRSLICSGWKDDAQEDFCRAAPNRNILAEEIAWTTYDPHWNRSKACWGDLQARGSGGGAGVGAVAPPRWQSGCVCRRQSCCPCAVLSNAMAAQP